MTITANYLNNPNPWNTALFCVSVALKEWAEQVKLFFERIWFAHHNARVILDFETRMSGVIHDATGGLMSKPYYDLGAMRQEIENNHLREFTYGYNEGVEQSASLVEDTFDNSLHPDVTAARIRELKEDENI